MAGLDARYHLAFMGAGFPSYATQIEALGLSRRVHFLPPVRPTQVVPFMRSADVGLILYHDGAPGVRWSLPNRFFQPVAAGLPILYPELPEIARLAREYALGRAVDTLDARSIRSGIHDLTNDPDLLDACRRNALAAGAALGWEQDEIKLATLIAETIGPPPATHSNPQAMRPARQ
jgi:glycosyltransferase involved in cell wall biosynthesis